jgi:TonB family protein
VSISKIQMIRRAVIALTMGTLLVCSTAVAQEKRVVKTQAKPAYPELAKRMNVSGSVKVELIVLPSGAVKSAKALGGHPLLIDAAVNAAKQSKYETASAETTEVMEFKFNSGQ